MIILTEHSVYSVEDRGGLIVSDCVLEERAVCGEALADGAVVALADGELAMIKADGVFRQKVDVAGRINCLHALFDDPLTLLIGTEPSHIYRIDYGQAARLIQDFEELSCRDDWYTPWGGPSAVRSLVHSGDRVYADIHVGSIMRSDDRGDTWQPVNPELNEDVHQVTISGAAPNRVYANTAEGVYVSDDGGDLWHHRVGGLPCLYGRAISVHPADSECVLATVSEGPHSSGSGRLFRSDNAGRSWMHVTDGFPTTTQDNIDTFRVCFDVEGNAWVAVEKTLYRSIDRGLSWEDIWTAPCNISVVSCSSR